ncbi:MAG TPA: ATP-binding SpoIIE family protein phosphatase [Candidatus Baltobacteraceae bacterium]
MTGEDIEWIWVEDESAPGRVRVAAMSLARRLDFSEKQTGEIGLAATELGTNLYLHAKHGAMLIRCRRESAETALELVSIDEGPGIGDYAGASRDGESTRGTLGIGIGAIRRAASSFDAYSKPGRGTIVVATFWSGDRKRSVRTVGALTRPMQNESACGDAWAIRSNRDGDAVVMLADGLGHGELAAMASREAVRTFLGSSEQSPVAIIETLNGALRGTRGAAVAVVAVSAQERAVTLAGVGNVALWIDDAQTRRALHSSPGIVGQYPKRVREVSAPVPEGAIVVLHSDGLSSKWDLHQYGGLLQHDPQVIAATLLRDAGVHRDDASVVVYRP